MHTTRAWRWGRRQRIRGSARGKETLNKRDVQSHVELGASKFSAKNITRFGGSKCFTVSYSEEGYRVGVRYQYQWVPTSYSQRNPSYKQQLGMCRGTRQLHAHVLSFSHSAFHGSTNHM